ncbi:MAG: hypothetical protein IPK67_17020 [Planctomycetes bacterium]|nr:hypothetical protein [Planctomycetota bacterium]
MDATPAGVGPERRASLGAKLLLLQGTLLLLFAALEFGTRWVEQGTRDRPFTAEDPFVSPWFPTRDWAPPRYDGEGRALFRHRDEPVSIQKPAGVVRVIAVGGSTTANKRAFALGGIDFALALERRLEAGGAAGRFEVLNAGAESFSTAHILVNLFLRLLEFEPDVVVCMENINDLSANYYGAAVRGDYGNKYLEPEFIDPALQSGRTLHGFLMRSRVLRNIPWLRRLAKTPEHAADDVSAGLALFRRNLREIAHVCEERGARLVLLSQPNNGVEDASYSQAQFALYNREIESVARECGVQFVDMFTLFGHDPKWFVDPVHYTPAGCEEFARILAEQVRF